jgi:hypothetical protein
MEIEDKVFMLFCFLAMIAVLGIIGGCTYVNRHNDNERFQLEQQKLKLLGDGKPTELEIVVHKLDDDQFKQLIEAIKENK